MVTRYWLGGNFTTKIAGKPLVFEWIHLQLEETGKPTGLGDLDTEDRPLLIPFLLSKSWYRFMVVSCNGGTPSSLDGLFQGKSHLEMDDD